MRPLRLGALTALVLALAHSPAQANGWEHGAVPFDLLLRALVDEDAGIRRRAAESLGHRGQVEAAAPLLSLLAAPEPAAEVRAAAYVALARLDVDAAVEPLVDCVENDPDATVRAQCVVGLGLLGRDRSLGRLLELTGEHQPILLRSRAVEALGSFALAPAVERLAALATGENQSLADRAIVALGRTGSERAAVPLLALLAAAGSERRQALLVDALAAIGAPAAVPALTTLLEQAANPDLRARVAVALGAVRDGSAVRALVRLLQDPLPGVRRYAVEALRELGATAAAAPLRGMLLALEPVRADGGFDRARAGATVAELVLLEHGLRALTELDAAGSAGLLRRWAVARPLAVDGSTTLTVAEALYEVRRRALYGLGYTGDAEAAGLLLGEHGLGDADGRLRAVAARSLGVLGADQHAAALVAALADDVAQVRWTAALVLGRLGVTAAAAPLMDRLADPDREVRRQAALALGYLRAAPALPLLRSVAAGDVSAPVRAAAGHAVALIETAG